MAKRIHFGHCVSCDQPIRPPHMSFAVKLSKDGGHTVEEWDEADLCDPCAAKLTATELFRLVTADEQDAAA